MVQLSDQSENALHINASRVLNEANTIVDASVGSAAPINKIYVLLVSDRGEHFEIRRLQGGMNSKETHFWMDMSKKLNIDLYISNP